MLKFYHAPWSRSSSVLWLLEELGVDYDLVEIDIRQEGGVPEDYRRIQPSKKVPAIDHDGTIITERAAITIYLADRFAQAGLAPAIDDPIRGPYLTMLVYCDAVFDPSLSAQIQGWTYQSNHFAFGLAEDMINYVDRVLTERPFAAGDRFTAADTQLASAIAYTMDMMKALPERPSFRAYLDRVKDRPAYLSAAAKDQKMAMATPFFQKQFGDSSTTGDDD
ncbi:MAG: glutathione S-transferase family protein [Rhizobiaceae bacterium]|nr:glutathione S-transferase family protein [Rhizobiaceae bacterium]MCV0406365.1 glutathione S-transferase family protein [Rhizobiaceae bacterium]